MGRSVSYATGAAWVLYTVLEADEDEDMGFLRWTDLVEDLRSTLGTAFRSLRHSDEWIGREDQAIMENDHAYIGLSEYCGLVSVWCKPKDDESALALRWCEQIEERVKKMLSPRLVKRGTFSNGEAVFERVN